MRSTVTVSVRCATVSFVLSPLSIDLTVMTIFLGWPGAMRLICSSGGSGAGSDTDVHELPSTSGRTLAPHAGADLPVGPPPALASACCGRGRAVATAGPRARAARAARAGEVRMRPKSYLANAAGPRANSDRVSLHELTPCDGYLSPP